MRNPEKPGSYNDRLFKLKMPRKFGAFLYTQIKNYLTLICLSKIILANSDVPFFEIVRRARADNLIVTNLFNSFTQILFF